MSYLHQGLPYEDFVRPDNVVSVLIDTKTGNLASRSTPGIYRSMELFKSGTEPSTYSSGGYDASSDNTWASNSYPTGITAFVPHKNINSHRPQQLRTTDSGVLFFPVI